MNTYTEDQIVQMVDGLETVRQMAKDYFWTRYRADPKWDHTVMDEDGYSDGFEGFHYTPSVTSITFIPERVKTTEVPCPCVAEGEPFCEECEWTGKVKKETPVPRMVEVLASARACGGGCCGYDSHNYRFPLAYLWMDQTAVLADMKAKSDAKAQAAAEEKAREDAEDRKRQEAYDREQLKKLIAKYPEEVK